jgi:hypothetical protein
MLPDGVYYGTISGAQVGKSAKKQTPQIVITFRITHQADSSKPEGSVAIAPATASVYVYLSEGAWLYSEKKLEALGFNFDWTNPAFTEKGSWLTLKHELYEGKQQERWELPGDGGGAGEALTADEIRTLTARRQKKQPTTRPRPTPPAQQEAAQPAAAAPATAPASSAFATPPPPTGDEIPF